MKNTKKGNLDAILSNTSGCGTTMKDYGFIFKNDEKMKKKAKVISELTRDVSEYLNENLKVRFQNQKIRNIKLLIILLAQCSMDKKFIANPWNYSAKTRQ